MTPEPRPWLPQQALKDDTLIKRIIGDCTSWSARWFAEPRDTSVRMRFIEASPIARGATIWRAHTPGFAITITPHAELLLASWTLGFALGSQRLNPHDESLLRGVAQECASDFFPCVAQTFSVTGTFAQAPEFAAPSGACFTFAIGAASPVFELYVSDALLIAGRKACVRKQLAPSPLSVNARENATARQTVKLGAMVGVGRLGLSELYNLAAGDVLVLDRGHNDKVALTIDGAIQPQTRCDLRQDNGELKLRIAQWEAAEPL